MISNSHGSFKQILKHNKDNKFSNQFLLGEKLETMSAIAAALLGPSSRFAVQIHRCHFSWKKVLAVMVRFSFH